MDLLVAKPNSNTQKGKRKCVCVCVCVLESEREMEIEVRSQNRDLRKMPSSLVLSQIWCYKKAKKQNCKNF